MNREEVRQLIESKGYVFDGVVPFKHKDRIKWHGKGLQKVSLCIGKKIKDIAREELEMFIK